MSNFAGKATAITVVTPIPRRAVVNRLIFWALRAPRLSGFAAGRVRGLLTLSLIHYARWVIVAPNAFPRFHPDQPRERLTNSYQIFCSNFNGSWDQYIDSFSMAIPSGLDLFWYRNSGYPQSVPVSPFHKYIKLHEVENDYYFGLYPLASANDIKAAQHVLAAVKTLVSNDGVSDCEFADIFATTVDRLGVALAPMGPAPVVDVNAS